ncbi:asparagine synthetase B family protein [Streptomyces sp. BHT-5-2]|uniref:asparagine synthase-related protein n=1 Tax=Streptomyces sp. BHT-5-2 TaxID=2866715 RepID=UPI001C8DB7B1|nr:asparagine synthase-related protein [Streptomyces sp. BHT-5-2]QZL02221.1 asparagine synthetase B family protein [Streptomyces sp. BHT-5-2]
MDFLVFPDHPVTDRLAARLPRTPATRTITHLSGRPWIVGHWRHEELVTERVGPRCAVLLGTTSATSGALARVLRRLRGLDDLAGLRHELPGSFFLLARMGAEIRAQGSLSAVRRLHRTELAGITVLGSRPQDLAALAHVAADSGLPGAPGTGTVDEEALAARLLAPGAPLPLALRTPWRAVHAVPPGHCAAHDPAGRYREDRWWSPPEPDLPLPDAAEAVREALSAAVHARTHRATLSADLSGGLDSTSVCFLAARDGTELITTGWEGRDPADDGPLWSAHSAYRLSRVRHEGRHLSLPYTDAPTWYTPPALPAHTDPAGPLAAVRDAARLLHQARLVAKFGSRMHLAGVGGDELFALRPVALNSLARGDLRAAVRLARRARRLAPWSLPATVRTLLGGRCYPRWLAAGADRIAPGARRRPAGTDWEDVPAMPPWAHPDAVATVRRLLREAAVAAPEPFDPLRAQHETAAAAVRAGERVRGIDALTSAHGVAYEAPFLDDAVIEAALAVRLADRVPGDGGKPVLAAAMRGIVPGPVLGRRGRRAHSAELHAGLRRNRRALTALCADSRLAALGLIRPEALRPVLTSLQPDTGALRPLDPTLAAEFWLRALPARPAHGTAPPPAARTTAPAAESD